MRFAADQYLQISDRLVEKAARCDEPERMGRLLGRANQLWHRARRLRPPTSEMLTDEEIARLRREAQVGSKYFRMVFKKRALARRPSLSASSQPSVCQDSSPDSP